MKTVQKCTYNYINADVLGMKSYMMRIKWKEELQNKNIEEMWCTFLSILNKCRNKKTGRRKKKPMWMDSAAHKAQNRKHTKYDIYKKFKTERSRNNYKEALNYYTKEARRSKEKFERKLAQNIKSDTKSFFAYVRTKSRTKDKLAPLVDRYGELSLDDRKNANILNTLFGSMFTKENIESMTKPRQQFDERKGSKLTDIEIEPHIVEKKLRNLKLNKAAGMDGIHTNILKALSEEMSLPLCMIFKKSLDQGVVPFDWRAANVVPLYKKGSKNIPSNYRPVSLTSVVCKILESIIKDAISTHLESNSLIKSSQHGFSSGKSCLTNLLIYLEQVTSEIDKGIPVDTLYLDFAKAFDKVPHHRLIEKIAANGIGGKISKWIQSWLTDRKQRVIVNNVTSDWIPVISGVPQGSVLGPCLFVIYINDIDDAVSSKILKFADDTKITASISSVEERNILQTDLTRLMEWSEAWQMKFNVNKCKVMHYGFNNPSY